MIVIILCAQLRPWPLDEPFGLAFSIPRRGRVVNCKKGVVLYIDSFTGNYFIIICL
jgi:hypothetical protein